VYIDNAIGSIINELKALNLFTTTSIIITAKHGQSPRNPNLVRTTSRAAVSVHAIDTALAHVRDALMPSAACRAAPRATVSPCREHADK